MQSYRQASPEEKAAIKRTVTGILTNRPEITLALLFGSFVAEPWFRDIDLGVWVDGEQLPPAAEFEFASALATELEVAVRLPVDLVVLNRTPVAFRHNALRGEVLVKRDPDLYDRLLEKTWKEYADLEPLLRKTLRDLLE